MGAELEFRGLFKPPVVAQLVPGNWYLGFRCHACYETFAIMDEPTGDGEVEPMGDGLFEVACPACGAENRYAAGDLLVFQSASAMSDEFFGSGDASA